MWKAYSLVLEAGRHSLDRKRDRYIRNDIRVSWALHWMSAGRRCLMRHEEESGTISVRSYYLSWVLKIQERKCTLNKCSIICWVPAGGKALAGVWLTSYVPSPSEGKSQKTRPTEGTASDLANCNLSIYKEQEEMRLGSSAEAKSHGPKIV